MPATAAVQRTELRLHKKQGIAFRSIATEILYGGAAGGGKSHLIRIAAIAWCIAIPGLQVYIFRRLFTDLFKNHMEGPSGFPALLAAWIAQGYVRIDYSKNQIKFRNGPHGFTDGSRIHLCHCQYEKSVYGYQGAEIHVLFMDELTHFTKTMYRFLRSRVRMVGLKSRIPAQFAGMFPRIINGANPGGIGHNWVKADFVDFAAPLELKRAERREGGLLRQYVPARLEDNPSMATDDPDYEQRLEGLGDPALVRAMREGDWDIVAGGMFDDVWKRDVHVLAPFELPISWRIDRSFDWGSSKPFSVGWWAESDGTPARMSDGRLRHFPPRTLFRIGEWYGWNGREPNVGARMADADIAKGVLDYQSKAPWGKRVQPGPADTMIFDVDPGRTSIADEMKKLNVRWTEADKKPGTRKTGWKAMRDRFAAAINRDREKPQLYVFNNCTQFIRTVPVLPRDARDPDDVDTEAEDHIGDETRYRVMGPVAPTVGFSSYES